MRQLRQTPRARSDLIEIWLYIGADSPAAADAVLDGIARRLDRLVRYPLSGLKREDIAPSVRQLLAGRYLVFYRVTDEAVEVLRVLHGMRRHDPKDIA